MRPVVLSRILEGSAVGVNSASHGRFIRRNFAEKSRKEVKNAITAVKNWVRDAILTAIRNVELPGVKMALRSITESSGRRPNGLVQNLRQVDFSGNTENTPLMSASSRVDFYIDQYKNDETRNVENFEDDNFPALRPNYDKLARANHIYFPKFRDARSLYQQLLQ